LRHLQAFCEVVENDVKISHAAKKLFTSQPSVSRYLSDLEEEVGTGLFHRTDKRIIGLTEAGAEILTAAKRLLQEAANIKRIGRNYSDDGQGELTIGASHTTARYFLPNIIMAFMAKHPRVRLVIRQSDPSQLARLVNSGELEMSISPAGAERFAELVLIPCHAHGRVILTPRDHPLVTSRRLSLAQIAKFPLISYSKEFPAHAQIVRAFEDAKLTPNIVLTASDIDVMKTYVQCGLGVAIVASYAFDAINDKALRALDISHLIAPATVNICIRKGHHFRSYVYDLMELVSPGLSRHSILKAITAGSVITRERSGTLE
jgi:LysR family cys regulon transcriptional activator